MSLFVVVWHMGGAGRSELFYRDRYLEHTFSFSDFVNFHLLLLAVPTFIFISIFLFALKPVSVDALKKQLIRIFLLLSFWPVVFLLYQKGYHGLGAIFSSSPIDFAYKLLRGGNTIFYFFTSLMVCLVCAYLFLLAEHRIQLGIFTISVVTITALPYVTISTGQDNLSAYWNPLNFLPFTFGAVLLAEHKEKVLENRRIILLGSLALCLVFSIAEWNFLIDRVFFGGQGYAMPAYTRTSLLFGVIGVFIVALNPRIRANSVIRFMSTYSLALYCLHPFLMHHARQYVSTILKDDSIALYVSILLVVLSSYAIAILLRKYYLRSEIVL